VAFRNPEWKDKRVVLVCLRAYGQQSESTDGIVSRGDQTTTKETEVRGRIHRFLNLERVPRGDETSRLPPEEDLPAKRLEHLCQGDRPSDE
jgi:hypothetical protein